MVKTTIRLPEKLYTELKERAKSRGMTLNAYVLSALWKSEDFKSKALPDKTLDYLFATEAKD